MEAKVLSIIAARGGSKGLPDEHLRMLCGKRVIDYTFEYAAAARLPLRTVLSTDSARIAEAASEYGIETVMRPKEMAGDDSRIQECLIHTVEYLTERDGFHADYIVCLCGNIPIRKPGLLDEGIAAIQKSDAKSLRSMVPVGKMNPLWMSRLDEKGMIIPYEASPIYRRQELPRVFIDDGGIIIYSLEGLLETRDTPAGFTDASMALVVSPPDACVELDDMEDFRYAEYRIRRKLQEK